MWAKLQSYEIIIKLSALDDTIFDILCEGISIFELSKGDRIDYIIDNYSKSEIDDLVAKAETQFEYILKLDSLNEIEFNLLSDILSIPFESKEDKINYIINNYGTDLIDSKIKESGEKYGAFSLYVI